MATSKLEFRLGERLKAKVLEIQAGYDLLVSIEGSLMRVTNTSKANFKVGDTVDLVVVGVAPLQMQLRTDYLSKFERFV